MFVNHKISAQQYLIATKYIWKQTKKKQQKKKNKKINKKYIKRKAKKFNKKKAKTTKKLIIDTQTDIFLSTLIWTLFFHIKEEKKIFFFFILEK